MRIPICLLAIVSLATLVYADGPDDQAAPAPAPAGAPADASAPATPPAPPPKFGGFAFSGYIDGYITDNTDHPPSGYDTLQNFDIMNGQPELSMIKFTVDKSDSVFGFHVDVGTGETMRLIHAGDPAAQDHKALRYFEQDYLIFKPKKTHGSEFDFGTFVTSAGAEVIEANNNFNYSRSLLFAWAIPYYHFGLRETTPINKVLTLGFQVVNPWNETDGPHRFSNIGLTAAVTKGIYTWNTNYYVGDNNPVAVGVPSGGVRQLIDSTLQVAPNDKFTFYINGDYGRNNNPFGGGYKDWEGIAFATKYQVTKKDAIAGRAEYFKDPEGYMTGASQSLNEFTFTDEYKFSNVFITRLEARHDESSTDFFPKAGQVNGAYGQTTLSLGVMVVLGPYK